MVTGKQVRWLMGMLRDGKSLVSAAARKHARPGGCPRRRRGPGPGGKGRRSHHFGNLGHDRPEYATSAAEVAALAAKYRGQPIDVLVNNAGFTGEFMGPPQKFGTLDFAEGERMMAINAFGPLRVSEAFYGNVRLGQQKKIVAVTALLGVHSFTYGNFDGAYWYKVTKAAMNAAMWNLSREAAKDGVIVTLLAPGEVAVEKVRNPGPEFIAPEVSIHGMIGVIEGLTLNDSGAIIRYNGKRYEF